MPASGIFIPAKYYNLTNSAFWGVFLLQPRQRLVHQQQRVVVGLDRDVHLVEVHALPAVAVLRTLLAARVINQNAAHGLGGGRKEMIPIAPNLRLRPDQTQPRFVNQGRRLKRLPRRLVGHPNGGQLSQFLIDQREQFLGSLRVARLSAIKDVGHVAHATKNIMTRANGKVKRRQRRTRRRGRVIFTVGPRFPAIQSSGWSLPLPAHHAGTEPTHTGMSTAEGEAVLASHFKS